MKKEFWNFWFSHRRELYMELSFKYRITPWRVYGLAHGSRVRSSKENKLLTEMLQRGIICEIRPW